MANIFLSDLCFYLPAVGYGAMSIGGYCYGQADEDQERFKARLGLSSLVCLARTNPPMLLIATRPACRSWRDLLGHRSHLCMFTLHILPRAHY